VGVGGLGAVREGEGVLSSSSAMRGNAHLDGVSAECARAMFVWGLSELKASVLVVCSGSESFSWVGQGRREASRRTPQKRPLVLRLRRGSRTSQ
jgi:hypothetical protein